MIIHIVLIILQLIQFITSSSNSNPYHMPDGLHITVGPSNIPNGGRGLFATKDFNEGEIIEKCPLIVVSKFTMSELHPLDKYVFNPGVPSPFQYHAFGYCAIVNHKYNPNAYHAISDDDLVMVLVANTKIKKGDEIFISYGEDYWEQCEAIHPFLEAFTEKNYLWIGQTQIEELYEERQKNMFENFIEKMDALYNDPIFKQYRQLYDEL